MSHIERAMSPARRVLVAMDGSPYGLAAVEAAVSLAAELHAELAGLFVEDELLLRMAQLPVCREVALPSAIPRPLDPDALQRLLRAQAERMRDVLAATAEERDVAWSFEIARGRVVPASLESARETDLLVLGKENSAPLPAVRFSQRVQPSSGPLLVVYEDAPRRGSILGTALQLAVALDSALVLTIAAADGQYAALSREALTHLPPDIKVQLRPAALHDVGQLLAEAASSKSRLVVLGRACPLLTAQTLEWLVEKLDCPLALVQ